MIPYWILFAVWAAGAVQYSRSHEHVRNSLYLNMAGILTALMIGLRWRVGGDWASYARMFDYLSVLDLGQALRSGDPAYSGLNWLAAQAGLSVVTVNVVCGAIFAWGLIRFAKRQPNPWLAVLVAVPYLIIVVSMGYTRQATAIGIIMAALSIANERNLIRTVCYVVVAAAFHKSAVLALPVLGVATFRRSPIAAIGGSIVFVGAYFLFLSASADALLSNYVEGDYDSQGALVRVIMDVLAAVLFFAFRHKMKFDDFERAMWMTFAYLSFVSLAGLFLVSSTAGIDRVALFLIPLQIVIIGRLPYMSQIRRPANGQLLLAVVAYSLAVQFVWLNYADYSDYWVPYNAAPFASADEVEDATYAD